jgi:2-amino-4-hydroxy-6-hydroxymethyldihydropteridine diphosphokinase
MPVLIALGANLPVVVPGGAQAPSDTLVAALESLSRRGLMPVAVSRLYLTPCFPAGAGPDYVNAAARLQADLAPADLMNVLHEVEAEFGRERRQRWGMRTLDLDLIAADDQVLPDRQTWAEWAGMTAVEQTRRTPDRLVLPHPRLVDRAFVLVPLSDVAPEWVHPVTGQTVEQMRDALPAADLAAIQALPIL